MDKFYVGQRCRIVKTKMFPHLLGEIVTITGPRKLCECTDGDRWLGYEVDLDLQHLDGKVYVVRPPEESLKPIYDGDQPSTWEECAWRPKELEKA